MRKFLAPPHIFLNRDVDIWIFERSAAMYFLRKRNTRSISRRETLFLKHFTCKG